MILPNLLENVSLRNFGGFITSPKKKLRRQSPLAPVLDLLRCNFFLFRGIEGGNARQKDCQLNFFIVLTSDRLAINNEKREKRK